MRTTTLLALVALLSGCSRSSRPAPVLTGVEPAVGLQGQVTTVRILGQFRPLIHASFDDEQQSHVATGFVALLGGQHALEQVRYVDATELAATVPATLSAGSYALTVVDPAGAAATLPQAFTVRGGDAGPGDGPSPDGGLPDGAADGTVDLPASDAPADSTPWPDTAPWPDTTPWPDTAPWPDTTPWPPDGPPLYVNESFTSGTGVVSTKTGSWSVTGGALRQTSVNGNGLFAVAPVNVADYVAETQLAIHSIDNLNNIAEGAGLSVRVQPQTSPSFTPGQYTCFISIDQKQFGIVECSGTQTYCAIHQSTGMNVSYNTPYLVRATVSGNTITCEQPDQGKLVTIKDNSFSSGDVAVATFHASASFYYLKVWQP